MNNAKPKGVSPQSSESQRDSGTKPRVASNELPWGNEDDEYNPERVAAPCDGNTQCRRNPVGVVDRWRGVPRVARSSQPWAGGHNPVGIADLCSEQRWLPHSKTWRQSVALFCLLAALFILPSPVNAQPTAPNYVLSLGGMN